MKGHKGDYGIVFVSSIPRGKSETEGTVQPGEETVQGILSMSLQGRV